MSIEIRKVPKDWKHPKNASGDFIPLYEGTELATGQKEWDLQNMKWLEGFTKELNNEGDIIWVNKTPDEFEITFEEYDSPRPLEKEHMPEWKESELTHLMVYEDESEGTPLTSARLTVEELALELFESGDNRTEKNFYLGLDGIKERYPSYTIINANRDPTYAEWLYALEVGHSCSLVLLVDEDAETIEVTSGIINDYKKVNLDKPVIT